jgi:hypothetical protein
MTANAYFAVMLVLAGLLASEIAADAGAPVRPLVRLACACYASLGCATLAAGIHAADDMLPREIALVTNALAPIALVLALLAAWEHPPRAFVTVTILFAASVAGVVAAIGATFVAFALLFASVCAILALSARHFSERPRATAPAIASALALVAGAAAFLSDRHDAMIAQASFTSAGLVGLSLACAR